MRQRRYAQPPDSSPNGRPETEARMATVKQQAKRRLPKILRIIHARPKLTVSILFGIAVGLLLLLFDLRGITRILIGWDSCVALYLCIVYWTFTRSEIDHITGFAQREDEGRVAILILTVVATIASVAAIFLLLGQGEGKHAPLQLGFVTGTIILSWAFIHLIFALHYAHEYYTESPPSGGLNFPGKEKPDYWDFTYFSFVIGMTFQVSDVAITARSIRRIVLAHAIVAFLFNVALLAIMINIAATAISK
jgi:uncharacterized membrane protein